MNKAAAIAVSVLVLLIAFEPIFYMAGYIEAKRPFDKAVGGHILNAFYANTPELMLEELNLSLTGLVKLGITPDMYAAVFDWDKTPDRTVSYGISNIISIKNRIDAVIQWRHDVYDSNTTGKETLGDVYEAKMDNLRQFINEGKSYDNFRLAYFAHFHLAWYFKDLIMGLVLIFILLALFIVWRTY